MRIPSGLPRAPSQQWFSPISFLAVELFLQTKLSVGGIIHKCICLFCKGFSPEAGEKALLPQHLSLLPQLRNLQAPMLLDWDTQQAPWIILEGPVPSLLAGGRSDPTSSCLPQAQGPSSGSGQTWACPPSTSPAKERAALA